MFPVLRFLGLQQAAGEYAAETGSGKLGKTRKNSGNLYASSNHGLLGFSDTVACCPHSDSPDVAGLAASKEFASYLKVARYTLKAPDAVSTILDSDLLSRLRPTFQIQSLAEYALRCIFINRVAAWL
ncbi:hypothetical protein JCM33374_g1896 [Metschnikowia sp. JCM 33374]|nr:hypothetical protein JCM33374_g1896 [Metschnikowia sp. JCM 33374]